MQKIVVLADLHGNMTATLAIEKEINQIEPDEVWFLGDAVGKGPQNDKTCDWVRTHCQHYLGGNWDYGICSEINAEDEYYHSQLGKERMEWLRRLPRELELTISGIQFRLFHGRPVTPLFQGSDSDEMLSSFYTVGNKTYSGIICADSHRPYVRLTKMGYAINTGSVGNSIDLPRAHALLLVGDKDCKEPAPLQITIVSVPYDNEREAGIARESIGFPKRDAYITEILTGVYSR